VLTVSRRQVLGRELLGNGLQEEGRIKDRLLVLSRFDITLFGCVRVPGVNVVTWAPLLRNNEIFIEDFVRVNIDQADISIVSDSTTIVGLGDQVLDSLPRDSCFLVVRVNWSTILDATYVVC